VWLPWWFLVAQKLKSGEHVVMTAFLSDDFLLSNQVAHRLYRLYAEPQPIFDFHCHLSPRDIAENRQFKDLTEIWLEGDHYKWRAMRANGVPERFCTGDALPYEKFLAWAKTVPYTLRNPLYHWTHLELQRYFGITDLLDEIRAPSIWERANAALAGGMSAQSILRKFRVDVVCTTDDPTDDLSYHRTLAESGLATRILPTFRLDRAIAIRTPEVFRPWIEKLSRAANVDVSTLGDFLTALQKRHADFHEQGCRLSDHGLDHCYAEPCTEGMASQVFAKAVKGLPIDDAEHDRFASFMMLYFGHLDAEKGWTKQLHLGASRNINTRAYQALGPDNGFDTVGAHPQAGALIAYLDLLTRENALPQMILYNSNPADTYFFASVIGSFQDGSTQGKIQYGSAWWFLDQKQGITEQLDALSNAGLLSRFVGMLTDSRSFMSFPRHEYFRRVLCDLIGRDVVQGELPDDDALLGRMVVDICYKNADRYFKLPARNVNRQ
jgi:glucuronate isomerase